MTVFVAVLTIDLWMRANGSLKDRRRVVRSILDRARARGNLAVAEIDTGDDPQRAEVALACVGSNQHLLRQVLEGHLRRIEEETEAEVVHYTIEVR